MPSEPTTCPTCGLSEKYRHAPAYGCPDPWHTGTVCPTCHGTGIKPPPEGRQYAGDSILPDCPTCHGTGTVEAGRDTDVPTKAKCKKGLCPNLACPPSEYCPTHKRLFDANLEHDKARHVNPESQDVSPVSGEPSETSKQSNGEDVNEASTQVERESAETRPTYGPEDAEPWIEAVKQASTAEKPDTTLDDMVEFLCGTKQLNGLWFDEMKPGIGRYWWRNELRDLVASRDKEEV